MVFSIKQKAFFIFTNNFIDLEISSVLAVSRYGLLPLLEARVLLSILPGIRQPHSKELFGHSVNSTKKLHKPLLILLIGHSTFSTHCTNLFLGFRCVLTFLEIIKHNTPERLHLLFHLQH